MPTPLDPEIERFVGHLTVERRLAARSLALYRSALAELQALASADGVAMRQAQSHHLRRWTARLRERGLGSRAASTGESVAGTCWAKATAWSTASALGSGLAALGGRTPSTGLLATRPSRPQ